MSELSEGAVLVISALAITLGWFTIGLLVMAVRWIWKSDQ